MDLSTQLKSSSSINAEYPKIVDQYEECIIVKKRRDEEHYQKIGNQWKEARSNFFTHQIIQKLNEAQINQQHQLQIRQLFAHVQQDCCDILGVNLQDLGSLSTYKQLIQQLISSFNSINQKLSQKQMECPTISQMVQLKLTALKVVRIQYQTTCEFFSYSINAYKLFKIVHCNNDLQQFTIKGVDVKQFQQFIKTLAQSRLNQIQEQQNLDRDWMKSFKPLQSLQLSIDAQLSFILDDKKQVLSCLDHLSSFVKLFHLVSDIGVRIALGKNAVLGSLLEQLKKIKKIKIKIMKDYLEEADQSFTLLLSQLASLTEIAQIHLQRNYAYPGFSFSKTVHVNRFLAMEEILATLFQNNRVTHLKLNWCKNFPIFPKITTLQSIYLFNVSFRRNFNFIIELAESNPSLRSVTCYFTDQEWIIEEKLLNQLQQLSIGWCHNVALSIATHSPSNIRYLRILQSNVGSIDCLSRLFPKLVHLTILDLSKIDFGSELICLIPSPHLEQLHIVANNSIESKDLQAIDKKWPYLRKLILQKCPKLNEGSWSQCEFKGLFELWIDSQTLAHGQSARQQLREKGVKVYSWEY